MRALDFSNSIPPTQASCKQNFIFHNKKSVNEIARINARLEELRQKYGKDIPDEERRAVLADGDLELYNLPNDKLLGDINEFFDKSIYK